MNQNIRTLTEAVSYLDNFFSTHTTEEEQLSHLGKCTEPFDRRTLINVLTDVLNNPQKLEEIAARSYKHELGFDKIVLHTFPEYGHKLRLHIWWPNSNMEPVIEGRHTHRWHFASRMQTGKFENHQYFPREVTEKEQELYDKVVQTIEAKKLDYENILERLEAMAVLRLENESPLIIAKGGSKKLTNFINSTELESMLEINSEELSELMGILVSL